MKIFLGMFNIASLYVEYTKGFSALGHEVFSVDMQAPSPIIDHSHTSLQIPLMVEGRLREEKTDSPARREHWWAHYMKVAWQKALEADVCFFIWRTFMTDNKDIVALKQMGKKIIVRFVGSEVYLPEIEAQWAHLNGQAYNAAGLSNSFASLSAKLHYVRMMEKYADLTIGVSTVGLRPSLWDFLQVDLDSIPYKQQQNEIPVLLHAPSNTATKGTNLWKQVFADLRGAGLNFKVRMVQNMSHLEFLKEYSKADISCGGIFRGGKAELEAMAGGCVAVAHAAPWPPTGQSSVGGYISLLTNRTVQALQIADDADKTNRVRTIKRKYCEARGEFLNLVQRITPESVSEILKALILNHAKRQQLVFAGRKFVEEFCSPAKKCQEILQSLAHPDSIEAHARLITLDFFYKQYIPRQDSHWLRTINMGNKMVKDCLWYKQYIVPLQRDGLEF